MIVCVVVIGGLIIGSSLFSVWWNTLLLCWNSPQHFAADMHYVAESSRNWKLNVFKLVMMWKKVLFSQIFCGGFAENLRFWFFKYYWFGGKVIKSKKFWSRVARTCLFWLNCQLYYQIWSLLLKKKYVVSFLDLRVFHWFCLA